MGNTFRTPDDKFFCIECGFLEDCRFAVLKEHQFNGATVSHMVCGGWCSEQSACIKTFSGKHGEIVTLDNIYEIYRSDIIQLIIIKDLPPDLEEAPENLVGICSLCKIWQVYDIKNNAWRDPRIGVLND